MSPFVEFVLPLLVSPSRIQLFASCVRTRSPTLIRRLTLDALRRQRISGGVEGISLTASPDLSTYVDLIKLYIETYHPRLSAALENDRLLAGYSVAPLAIVATRASFPDNPLPFIQQHDNNPENAFQHCYWSALMTFFYGSDVALETGNFHEASDTSAGAREKEFDQFNNRVGREIGAAADLLISP